MSLTIGDEAPGFRLPTDEGSYVSLSDFRDKHNVILYFYPKDDTPGCTIEAKAFRDEIEKFRALDSVVIGVSKDSVSCHSNFKLKYSLPFVLLSDEQTEVMQKYGVWVQKSMFGKEYMGAERATFLIDRFGKIVHIWRNVKVAGHVADVLKTLKGM